MEERTKINRGILSAIERGRTLPTDRQMQILEQAYGLRRDQFYSAAAPFGLTCALIPDEEKP